LSFDRVWPTKDMLVDPLNIKAVLDEKLKRRSLLRKLSTYLKTISV
jgi:hypothetical protein